MKITKQELNDIIKEEIRSLVEGEDMYGFDTDYEDEYSREDDTIYADPRSVLPVQDTVLDLPSGAIEVTDVEEKVKNFLSTKAYTSAGMDDAGRADFVRKHHREFTQFILDGEVYHIYGDMMVNSADEEVFPDSPKEVVPQGKGYAGPAKGTLTSYNPDGSVKSMRSTGGYVAESMARRTRPEKHWRSIMKLTKREFNRIVKEEALKLLSEENSPMELLGVHDISDSRTLIAAVRKLIERGGVNNDNSRILDRWLSKKIQKEPDAVLQAEMTSLRDEMMKAAGNVGRDGQTSYERTRARRGPRSKADASSPHAGKMTTLQSMGIG